MWSFICFSALAYSYLWLTFCSPAVYSKLVPPPVYTVNLSLPAAEMWAEVARDFAPKFPKLFAEIEAKLPKELLDEVAAITPDLNKYLFPRFVEEMKGIARHGNVSMKRIVLLNLLYDIHAYDQTEEAPSIHVAVNSAIDPNNPIIVGSTFSWVYTPLLRDMIIVVGSKISEDHKIRGTTFAGMVGLHSGVIAADFSASYAERKTDPSDSWKVLFELLRSGNSSTLALRIRHKQQFDVLGELFPSAVQDFSSFQLLAPSYLMLGGWNAGQGVIITRDRLAAYDKQFFGDNWYLVGTNVDPWIKPPDAQKKLIMDKLEKKGSAMDIPELLAILETPELYNNHTAFVTATTPCFWGEYTTLVYQPD